MTQPPETPGPLAGSHGWLSLLRELGGFAELSTPPFPTEVVPWPHLLGAPLLTQRIERVRSLLASSSGGAAEQVPRQVATSALQMGLVSRLWSVSLSSAVLYGWVPRLAGDLLVSSTDHGGPVPLGLQDPSAGVRVDSLSAAVTAIRSIIVPTVATLDQACHTVGRTALRVLQSNSASSLVGAARVLASQRPTAAGMAWTVARQVHHDPWLRTGGRWSAAPPPASFRRTGCCLFYRLPGHGLCGDCVLTRRPGP